MEIYRIKHAIHRKPIRLEYDCVVLLLRLFYKLRFLVFTFEVNDVQRLSLGVLVFVEQLDFNSYRLFGLDFDTILFDSDVKELTVSDLAGGDAHDFLSICYVVCILVRGLFDLSNFEFGVQRDACSFIAIYSYFICIAICALERGGQATCTDNAIDGKLVGLELDRLHRLVFALLLGVDLRIDDFGLLFVVLVKVYSVDIDILADFHCLIVFNPYLDHALRLDLFSIIDEGNIVELCERQAGLFVILVLHFAQSLLIVLLVRIRIALFGNLSNLKLYALGELGACAKICIDCITVIMRIFLVIITIRVFVLLIGFVNVCIDELSVAGD